MTTPAAEDTENKFKLTAAGNFMYRYGAAGPDAPHSDKKVCFVATDKSFLVSLLYELSMREDCYYVKYSVLPRDGMYLGRCFLASDEAAARLCGEYKSHAKLMTTLQDDAFFNTYR